MPILVSCRIPARVASLLPPARSCAIVSRAMASTLAKHDLLSEIPSPSRRLWVGLCITLSIFGIFALYAIHEVRWLENFQTNVVQKNRLA